MEQHIENVLNMYTQRQQRRAQLEAEMSQCQLSAATQAQISRMLDQKESNYLRLRRAKMDRLYTNTYLLTYLLTYECSFRKSQTIYD